MKFLDKIINRELRFSIGIEAESQTYYLSIPVSNRMVDYEEYYKITEDMYLSFVNDASLASTFAEECRKHMHDGSLFMQPGSDRGIAT